MANVKISRRLRNGNNLFELANVFDRFSAELNDVAKIAQTNGFQVCGYGTKYPTSSQTICVDNIGTETPNQLLQLFANLRLLLSRAIIVVERKRLDANVGLHKKFCET